MSSKGVQPGQAAPPAPGAATGAPSSASSGRLELNVTTDPANLAEVRRACERFAVERCGLDTAAADQVGLCVNEAMANVTRHAYGGAEDRPVRVVAEQINDDGPAQGGAAGPANGTAAGMRVSIRDWGSGVNPDCLPQKPHDPLQPGGLGLICLHELMDEVVFEPQPDGMLLAMTKRRAVSR